MEGQQVQAEEGAAGRACPCFIEGVHFCSQRLPYVGHMSHWLRVGSGDRDHKGGEMVISECGGDRSPGSPRRAGALKMSTVNLQSEPLGLHASWHPHPSPPSILISESELFLSQTFPHPLAIYRHLQEMPVKKLRIYTDRNLD